MCHSGVSFDPVVDGRLLSFHVSGLYEGKFVMRDAGTGSQWLHLTGECVLGPYTGRVLQLVPTMLISWRSFRSLHPKGTVVAPTNPRWRRVLSRIMAKPPFFFIPAFFWRTMAEPDRRLPDSELGLGVVIGRRRLTDAVAETAARFYPLQAVRAAGAINDRVGDVPVVVTFDPWSGNGVAFIAAVDGRELRFCSARQGILEQEKSGSQFDLCGRCISGPLQGKSLQLAPAISARWYGFVATYPNASVWTP